LRMVTPGAFGVRPPARIPNTYNITYLNKYFK
jgi:hypothetical protein